MERRDNESQLERFIVDVVLKKPMQRRDIRLYVGPVSLPATGELINRVFQSAEI